MKLNKNLLYLCLALILGAIIATVWLRPASHKDCKTKLTDCGIRSSCKTLSSQPQQSSSQPRKGARSVKEIFLICLAALPDEESDNLPDYYVSIIKHPANDGYWVVRFDRKLKPPHYLPLIGLGMDVIYDIAEDKATFLIRD